MPNDRILVPARTYLAWWQALAERLAAQPDDKGLGTLLWQLDVIGRASEANRLHIERGAAGADAGVFVVSSAPDRAFDWDAGAVSFDHPGYLTVEPEVLIHDLVKVTGIALPE